MNKGANRLTNVPKREWAQHLRPDGKDEYWGRVRADRRRALDQECALAGLVGPTQQSKHMLRGV